MKATPSPGRELMLTVPDGLLEALAERVAELVNERLQARPPASPWLDFDGALEYLRFSRDQLYKLTAARAIPFRKRRGGQALLFHREELDRWLEREFEPTGCFGDIELWSPATK